MYSCFKLVSLLQHMHLRGNIRIKRQNFSWCCALTWYQLRFCNTLAYLLATGQNEQSSSVYPEDGSIKVLRNIGILPGILHGVTTRKITTRWKQHGPPKRWYLPHHYTVSQRRARLESSPTWEPQILQPSSVLSEYS